MWLSNSQISFPCISCFFYFILEDWIIFISWACFLEKVMSFGGHILVMNVQVWFACTDVTWLVVSYELKEYTSLNHKNWFILFHTFSSLKDAATWKKFPDFWDFWKEFWTSFMSISMLVFFYFSKLNQSCFAFLGSYDNYSFAYMRPDSIWLVFCLISPYLS